MEYEKKDTKQTVISCVEMNEIQRQMLIQKKEIERLKQVQRFMEIQRNTAK